MNKPADALVFRPNFTRAGPPLKAGEKGGPMEISKI